MGDGDANVPPFFEGWGGGYLLHSILPLCPLAYAPTTFLLADSPPKFTSLEMGNALAQRISAK